MLAEDPEENQIQLSDRNDSHDEYREDSSLRSYLYSVVRFFALSIIIAFLIKIFILEAFTVPSLSMYPTLQAGDVVLVNKLLTGARVFTFRFPGYGSIKKKDIIAFYLPVETAKPVYERTKYVKRCTAVPGDTIEIVNGVPEPVNGPLHSTHYYVIPKAGQKVRLTAANFMYYSNLLTNYEHVSAAQLGSFFYVNGKPVETFTFGQNYYFMTGDNQGDSFDSRDWGLTPEDHLIGRVMMVMTAQRDGKWNWSRFFTLLK